MASRESNLHRYPDEYFPDSYLVLDIETTGFSPKTDYVTQFGFAWVLDRKVRDAFGFLVQIPPGSMSKGASEVTGITEEMCNTKGMRREDAFRSVYETFTNWRNSRENAVFVGHNAAKFDLPFIEKEFEKLNLDFRFADNELVDTGAIVKADQLGTYPQEGETLHNFMSRVGRFRATGVYWSLPRYCIDRYNLKDRIEAAGLASHDASADCIMTHWVLEAVRAERQQMMEKHGTSVRK